jgi:hypothetical protein
MTRLGYNPLPRQPKTLPIWQQQKVVRRVKVTARSKHAQAMPACHSLDRILQHLASTGQIVAFRYSLA